MSRSPPSRLAAASERLLSPHQGDVGPFRALRAQTLSGKRYERNAFSPVSCEMEESNMSKLDADDRKKLPPEKFAEPKKRAYPIEDKSHARNAKARASQAVEAGRMSKAEKTKIDKKADSVLKQ